LAVGAPWIVNVAFDVAGLAQGAVGFADHVSVRMPAVMSAALGVYVVLAKVGLPNVPVPFDDHVPEAEFVEVAEMSTGALAQVVYGPPALAVGAPWMVSEAFDVAGLAHGAVGFADHVSMRVPAVMSAVLGV
jgi:hypothetical protein